jgi:hypothetical protein
MTSEFVNVATLVGLGLIVILLFLFTTGRIGSRDRLSNGLSHEIQRLNLTIDTLLKRNEELLAEIGRLRIELERTQTDLRGALERNNVLVGKVQSLPSLVTEAAYLGPKLLVGVGDDPALLLDVTILRTVKSKTGLDYNRIQPVTKDGLERMLARRRLAGDPVRYVHLGVHAGPQGLQFADGLATGAWLSEHFAGVLVLLIAGCQADGVGDLLGVVPAVITLREDLRHEDAADLTLAFWTAIGEGLTATAAFLRMRERCPAVADFAELHR